MEFTDGKLWISKNASYNIAFFWGLQISQILWIFGISMKFVLPKISRHSFYRDMGGLQTEE